MYHELTVWSRGIIMDKEARDVSACVAAAARELGYYAENVSDYVDDPDRTNCLVRRYARFAGEPILDRFIYENPHPDWVVLVEETIIKGVNFFRGTSPWMFVRDVSELAFDRMSTEGAVERLAIGTGIAAPLIGALVAATGELSLDVVAEVVADRGAMFRGARQHAVIQYAPI